MPVYRMSAFFRLEQQGWVESWYLTQPDMSLAAGQAALIAGSLLGPRDERCVSDGVRVIQVSPLVPLSGRHIVIFAKGGRAAQVGQQDGPDLVGSSAWQSASFSDGSKRPVFIRGLLDIDVMRDPDTGRGVAAPGLLQALNLLGIRLTGFGASLRKQSSAVPEFVISKIQAHPTNPGLTQLLGDFTGSTYAVGNKVKFRGTPLKSVPWLKGIWKLREQNATSIAIAYPYPLALPVMPNNMRVFLVLYDYPTFAGWSFEDFRGRKTGRPITLTRGRSPGINFRR